VAPKHYAKNGPTGAGWKQQWSHWSWTKTLRSEGAVSKQEHHVKTRWQSTAVSGRQPSSLPPGQAVLAISKKSTQSTGQTLEEMMTQGINQVHNSTKNWPQKQNCLSRRFRGCGDCVGQLPRARRQSRAAQRQQGGDNASSKLTPGSRRPWPVLRAHLTSCWPGGTSHAAGHGSHLAYAVCFHRCPELERTHQWCSDGEGERFCYPWPFCPTLRGPCLDKWKLSQVPGYKTASLKLFK